jgi:N-acyl-D-aspartate/D-glutamate deacylase
LPTAWAASLFDLIDEVNAKGGRMFGQTHSRGIWLVSSFQTAMPFDRIPEWAAIRALPDADQLLAFQDANTRQRLIEAVRPDKYGEKAVGAEARPPDFDRYLLFDDPIGANRSVGEIARATNADPVEVVLEAAVSTGLRQLFIQPMDGRVDGDMAALMRRRNSVMTFSDSGAHVSQIIDASIQSYFLAHWCRDLGAFSLEEAVSMLTLVPATAWGFVGRGVLEPGAIADINVFDFATVGPMLPTVERDLPAGAKRLSQRSAGFKATLVDGTVTIANGEHTGEFPGRLLRSGNGRVAT